MIDLRVPISKAELVKHTCRYVCLGHGAMNLGIISGPGFLLSGSFFPALLSGHHNLNSSSLTHLYALMFLYWRKPTYELQSMKT